MELNFSLRHFNLEQDLMKNHCLFLCFCLFLVCESKAQIGSNIDILASSYLESEFAKAISIAILNKDEISYHNYGKISTENPVVPTKNSIYEIGSISKAVTSTLLQQLISENKLSLDDDMCDYMPEGSCQWTEEKKITIRELATHTSGIPRLPYSFFSNVKDMNRPYENHREEDLVRFLKSYDPAPIEDRVYEYSNYGMMILGYILEQVEGKSYEMIMLERLLKPLEMYRTFVMGNEDIHAKIIQGHSSNGKETPVWDMPTFPGPGGIRSTTSDMMKFMQYVINDPIASKATNKQIQIEEQKWIGLGWHIFNYEFTDKLIVLHNGQTGGYTAFAGFIEGSESAVVVLCNNSGLEDKPSACDLLGLEILDLLSKSL